MLLDHDVLLYLKVAKQQGRAIRAYTYSAAV